MKHSGTLLLSLCVAGGAVFSACNGKGSNGSNETSTDTETLADGTAATDDGTATAQQDVAWSVDAGTLTYGSHTYTMQGNFDTDYVSGGEGTVTFTNVPQDYREFKTVYEQLLGNTTYGTAALVPIAFEMWGRDHAVGEECLKLISGGTCYNEIMSEMPRHMEASQYSPSGDPYVQRCLPAALIAGATKENGYNPPHPYKVKVAIGRQETWGQESEMLQANVYQLNIVTENAWNTPLRGVSVMKQWRGDGRFKLNNCSACYINIYVPRQDWNGLK